MRVQAVARGFRQDRARRNIMRGQPAFGQSQMRAAVRRCGQRPRFRLADRVRQFGQPAPAHRHCGDDRHPQRLFQRGRVQQQPVPFGQIDHVERHHDRAAEFNQFLREDQMLFEV